MREVQLTKGLVAIVDDEDFEKVNQFKWYAHESGTGNFYARHDFPGRKRVYMHRFLVANDDPKVQIDHVNGNKLDNRKENLRMASNQENSRNQVRLKSNNTSNFRGVYFYKDGRSNPYASYINLPNKKRKCLGSFKTGEAAARAFNAAAKEIYGEFCGQLNDV